MELRGRRVTIRPMRRDDLDAMQRWRPAVDPVYQPFDFPQRSQADHYLWYDERCSDPSRRLYTVENEQGCVIGSLTLRDIDGSRSARLGITLGADFVSRGYGTDALEVFLDSFFRGMGFLQMNLDVAAINQRAMRAYRRLGFREVERHYQVASHASLEAIFQQAGYRHLRPLVRRKGGALELLFYEMVLTRQDWFARARSL